MVKKGEGVKLYITDIPSLVRHYIVGSSLSEQKICVYQWFLYQSCINLLLSSAMLIIKQKNIFS